MKHLLTAALFAFTPVSVNAQSFWQDPEVGSCEMEPGKNCAVTVKCPSWASFVDAPAFGLPEIEPSDANVGLISSFPVELNQWRFVWRNNGDENAKIKYGVKLRCGKIKDW